MQSIYDIEVKTIEGKTIKMSEYKNKVLLIVNVASFCGFTSQYEGLEKLYKKYKTKDFVVLGFPCNQFMNQEPEDEQKIKEFCSLTYDVTFPMFSKVEVNGENTHDLYKLLKQEASGVLGTEAIKWNFTKFLVNKQGKIVERFAPSTTPESLEKQIENLL
ncbi:glutathione peroxidase [Malaciobacter mytili]|uniref:Glutathione peroxidase n=1 Tax=Malaciobacter mytili LMG 24559 TaxID=1032238 RepID=A0AAX2AH83_9BACT|nr:glutathione peroxidase [Malaciobacter mytili]RXK15732.1 glutathione peroxidase [Malaciobacter mytili LMG 24559]